MKPIVKSPIFRGLLLGGAGFSVNGYIFLIHGGLTVSFGGVFYLLPALCGQPLLS